MAPGLHLHRHIAPVKAPHHGDGVVVKGAPTSENKAVYSTSHEAEKDAKKHQHRQHLAETCAVASAAFALHERRSAKKHPHHEEKHKRNEHVAIAVAAGAGVLASHEKHEKKNALKQAKLLRRHGY